MNVQPSEMQSNKRQTPNTKRFNSTPNVLIIFPNPISSPLNSVFTKYSTKIATFENKLYYMTRQNIIERTLFAINQLPDDRAQEISNFADFIFKRYEEEILSAGITKLISKGSTFEFLNKETEDYTLTDLKDIYND
jgi:hypothetical protein